MMMAVASTNTRLEAWLAEDHARAHAVRRWVNGVKEKRLALLFSCPMQAQSFLCALCWTRPTPV